MEEVWGYLKEPEDYVQLANMPEVEHFANEEDEVPQQTGMTL